MCDVTFANGVHTSATWFRRNVMLLRTEPAVFELASHCSLMGSKGLAKIHDTGKQSAATT